MYEMAKKAREAMKSKARKMAGEKDQKVDSSDWSPSEPLNAEAKTGMRPISRRAFQKGGKVTGASAPVNLGRKARKSGGKVESEKAEAAEYAKAKTNRNVKAANEERPGVKHVGGMKKGGRTKKASGGDVPQPELGKNVPEDYLKDPRHPGNAPAPVQMPKNPPMPPRRPAGLDAKSTMSDEEAEAFMRNRKHGGKAKARKDGGQVPTTLAGQKKIQREQAEASETHRGKASNYKKGGMAKKMDGGALMGGVLPALLMGGMGDDKNKKTPMKKGGRPGKFYGGGLGGDDMAMPPMAPGMQLPQMTPDMGGGAPGEYAYGGYARGGQQMGGMGKPAGMMGGQTIGQWQMGGMGKPAGMMGGQTIGQQIGGMGKPAGMMGGQPMQQLQPQIGGMGKPAGMMGGQPMQQLQPQVGGMVGQAMQQLQPQIGEMKRIGEINNVMPSPLNSLPARGGQQMGGPSPLNSLPARGGQQMGGPSPLNSLPARGGQQMGGPSPFNSLPARGGQQMGGMGGVMSSPLNRKSGGRAKGKTNVNIIISAGKAATPDMMQGPGGPLMPPPGIPVPLPGGPGGMPGGMPMGGAPGGMPPMPMPPPPMPGGMMGRKSGGRISKVAKSYKDMEAGSGGGEGRLQKTDIAKTGKGAPAYRAGGKVYRSYKDMDAGSGSGLGRMEKTSIQSGKR